MIQSRPRLYLPYADVHTLCVFECLLLMSVALKIDCNERSYEEEQLRMLTKPSVN